MTACEGALANPVSGFENIRIVVFSASYLPPVFSAGILGLGPQDLLFPNCEWVDHPEQEEQ